MLTKAAPAFSFATAKADDLDRLTALRVEAMRESLARIGRFDPDRARRRMVEGFRPEHTRLILLDGELAGCVAFRPTSQGMRCLEHFYLTPAMSGLGIGSAVMAVLMAEADAAAETVEITVVRDSDANRFYPRFGFVETGRDDKDVFYRRQPAA